MKSLREMLLANWGLKLTSIFLAFFLWLAVQGEPPAERVVTIPLEVVLPPDMEITGERPNTVDVTLRGSPSSMGLQQRLPTCRIDLQDQGEGIHVETLTPENVRLPRTSGIMVVSIRPARVRLVLERTISREIPIRVTRGDPPLTLEVYGVSVTPPTATIIGPRSHVERVREVRTESVPLSNQKESFRTLVRLAVEDSLIHVEPMGPVEVAVQLGVRRQLHTVTRVPLTADDPEVTVIPSRVTVSVLMPATTERTLGAADLDARVTTRGVGPGLKSFQAKPEVKLKVPAGPGVSIMEIKPAEVTVRRAAND